MTFGGLLLVHQHDLGCLLSHALKTHSLSIGLPCEHWQLQLFFFLGRHESLTTYRFVTVCLTKGLISENLTI